MGYLLNGVKTGGLPVDYVKRFAKEYDIKVFIETGTAGGNSVRAAAEIFEYCHSIEIVPGRPEGEFPDNVTLHEGDSADLAGKIAGQYEGHRIFFWLDAHWSDDKESDNKENECPLLREIEAVKGHDCFIMIDDARLFLGPHPWPCDYRFWPQFQDVFLKLKSCFPKHKVTIVDDYIVAIPDYMDDTFRIEWWERFKERYPEDIDRVKMEMRNSFEYLKKFVL